MLNMIFRRKNNEKEMLCFKDEQCENLNFSLFTDLLRVSCIYSSVLKKRNEKGGQMTRKQNSLFEKMF